jgi:NUMOD3 motif
MIKIYGIADPQTQELRYVGKASGLLRRRLKGHHSWWVRAKKKQGLKPEIFEIETVPESDSWQEAERFWIAYFRGLGCRLTNGTPGGEGQSKGFKHAAEVKRRISQTMKGRPKSATTRALMSAAQRGLHQGPAWNKGRPHSDETKSRLRAAWARWKADPAKVVERVMKAQQNRHRGGWPKGVPRAPETVEKIRAAKTGKPLSLEHRKALSEAQKLRWQRWGRKKNVSA